MTTFTYANLEDRIRSTLNDFVPFLPAWYPYGTTAHKRAIRILNEQRVAFRQSVLTSPGAEGLWILSPNTSITKLEKDAGVDHLTLAGLALAPADVAGVEVCPQRGACTDGCVAYSGNGRWDRTTDVRSARKMLLTNSPRAFFILLVHDLEKLRRRHPGGIGVRLNAFSDIRWERVLPSWFWVHYADVRFYDYTKHPLVSRPVRSMPSNYVLTYSWSEKSSKGAMARNINAGRNVAVVLATPGGKDRRTGELRPIPDEIAGFPVIDGDLDDRRYADERGHVVALRRKGTLAADSPFIYPLEEAIA